MSGLVSVVNNLAAFAVIASFAALSAALGGNLFFLYAALCAATAAFAAALLPETKGRSLEEIQAIFEADGQDGGQAKRDGGAAASDRARATQIAVANALNSAADRIEKTAQVLNRTIGGGVAIG